MADAGWYRDPSDPAAERWWDGSGWTDRTRPLEPVEGSPPSGEPTTVRRPPPGAHNAPTDPAGGGEPAADRPSWPMPPPPEQRPSWATPPPPPPGTGGSPAASGSSGTSGGRRGWLVGGVAVVLVLVLVVGGVVLLRVLGGGDDDPEADPSPTAGSSSSSRPSPTGDDAPRSSATFCDSGDPQQDEQHPRDAQTLYGGGLTMPMPDGYERSPISDQLFGFATDLDVAVRPLRGRFQTLYALGAVARSGNPEPTELVDEIVYCLTEGPLYTQLSTTRTLVDPEETTLADSDAWSAGAIMDIRAGRIEGGDVRAVLVDTGDDRTWGLFIAIVATDDDLGGRSDVTERDAVLGTVALD